MICYNCGKSGHNKSNCYQSSKLIECYDCHQKVSSLADHRKICLMSRKVKSIINPNNSSSKPKINIKQRADELDVFFLLDVSGSMIGTKLLNAKSVLLQITNILQRRDRVSIITFDSNAYYKLKLHPVKKVGHEIPEIINNIFAQGSTALYDAIHLAIEQIQDKNNNSIIFVLTDGDDNSSKHSYQSTLDLVKEYPNIHLHIIHIDNENKKIEKYDKLCNMTKGKYLIINDQDISITYKKVITETIIQVKIQQVCS